MLKVAACSHAGSLFDHPGRNGQLANLPAEIANQVDALMAGGIG